MKRVFIKTYGCQMNVYDSDRMMDALAAEGYVAANAAEEADLILLNTCHIREKAAEKVYSEIGKLGLLKKERAAKGEELVIGVAGCVAQAEGEEIMRRAKSIDLVLGPQSYHRLPQLLRQRAARGKAVETEFTPEEKFSELPAAKRDAIIARGVSAFLTIQEGCDKFCTFCVVPYTRGAEVSRPVAQILDEARRLIDAGVREITLLGQNVNAYHGEGPDGRAWSLGRLLFALADMPDLWRLRYMTSHPRDMHDELFAAHRDLTKLMPYMHLPVQSGSDRVLKAMNRRHTVAHYLKIIERLRRERCDIALSSDFIVGFPHETEEDFGATMRLVQEVNYASSFSFKYSPRPGTPAANEEQIAEDIKSERLSRLQALLAEQQKNFARRMIGRRLPVLLENPVQKPGRMFGRSPYLQAVQVEAPASLARSIVDVDIESATMNTLFGTLAAEPDTKRAYEDAAF